MTTLRALQGMVYDIALRKGWHTDEDSLKKLLDQLRKELDEMADTAPKDEELRLFNSDVGFDGEFPTQLADVIIRLLDIAERVEIDLDLVVGNRISQMMTD